MAEVKNSFLSSKMNKDLDDRLIPNSEYRDALNISIGKSESDSVGTVQNVLGNYELTALANVGTKANPIYIDEKLETNENLECIGFYMDNQNNRVYRFLTDYKDAAPTAITLAPSSTTHKITVYDFNTKIYSVLVEGYFLNFSTTNLIIGVNLIEGLLFWSDNRNQPRKINYFNAINNPLYYTTETQISVAKYAPVESPSMLIEIDLAVVDITNGGLTIVVDDNTGIVPGMTLIALPDVTAADYITVLNTSGSTIINLYSIPSNPLYQGQKLKFLISTMSNLESDPNWPGDPAYLESKYVRFSYRFKFDDNEYSIISPFTQIAFVPNQKGYFINQDEQAAYRSTVVKWMENNTNNIQLLIPLPDTGSRIRDTYKIVSVDVLYKESNSLALKVLDTINYSTIKQISPNTNIYVYNYQSQKPYKTLPEDQITRVYDKIPVRALAQETSGNRIMYGNFFTTYTAPSSINYNVSIHSKQDIFTNFIEYPNHTLKQNRNFQVGFILGDKFGRQSSVILSTVDLTKMGDGFGGSTIYSPYEKYSLNPEFVKAWPGNALTVLVNSPIESTRNIASGTPGLYAIQQGNGFTVQDSYFSSDSLTYTFSLDESGTPSYPSNIPVTGNYLRGKYTDYVTITSVSWVIDPPAPPYITDKVLLFPNPPYGTYIVTADGPISDLYLPVNGGFPDIKYSYKLNQIGWYSYKVVVKQKEQDYYNVYLPGMLNGYPVNQTSGTQVIYTGSVPSTQNGINVTSFPVDENDRTSHIVLINDNINKVPRDLAEVGPDQKQYRSSVELYGRVENSLTEIPFISDTRATSSLYATQVTYPLATYPEFLYVIKPGDGIQSVEAKLQDPLLFPWLANVVITSIKVSDTDPTRGVITFSPPSYIKDTFTQFVISTASNLQYYPIRKADIVNTIAYATDFNFLQNSVENISGSAGLNFYQLQSNPLIGRISTSKSIGALGDIMLPTLSVYETSPTESLLDLFWETASTGLISDLNWDINTGFDGASGTSPIGFKFVENQNPLGVDTAPGDTGSAECPYITNEFYILNATNVQINAPCVLTSVKDGNGLDVSSKFQLVEVLGSPFTYRIKILESFVFVYDLASETFNFELSATFAGITSILPFSGKMENIAPRFIHPEAWYNKFIDITATDVVTMVAVNGSFSNSANGLYWTIESSTAPTGYFGINASTGLISLLNPAAQTGTYYLGIKVQDAAIFSGAFPAVLVTAGEPNFSSKSDTINVVISIGEEPVDDGLQYLQGQFAQAPNPDYNPSAPVDPAIPPYVDSYFGVYVGDVSPLAPNYSTIFPTLPGGAVWSENNPFFLPNIFSSNPANVAYEAGNTGTGLAPAPTRLTKGAMRFKFYGQKVPFSEEAPYNVKMQLNILIYYRANSTSTWALVKDNNYNGTLTPNTWDGIIMDVAPSYSYPTGINDAISWVSLQVSNPGEYLFAIKTESDRGINTGVIAEDANYYYNNIGAFPGEFVNPFIPRERFMIGLVNPETNTGSNIPYSAASATEQFNFSVTTTVSAIAPDLTTITIVPVAGSDQIVPGTWVRDSAAVYAGTSKVFGVSGNEITLTEPIVGLTTSTSLIFAVEQPLVNPAIGEMGNIWASSKEGAYINQFYDDAGLTLLWNPPVANKFYNFKNHVYGNPEVYGPTVNYLNPPNIKVTGYNSAQIGINGNVINTNPLIQTVIQNTKVNALFNCVNSDGLTLKYNSGTGILDYWTLYNTSALVSELTSTSVKVTNTIDGDYLTWSSESTTPTYLYYPDTTISDAEGLHTNSFYVIEGLLPDTTYYILLYKHNDEGYINGEYHPVKITTLSA